MPCDPILSRNTLALFIGASAASLEQRPALGGAAQPVNSGCFSFPLYRSGVAELTTINEPDRTFITHSDRLLTFTATGTHSRLTSATGSS